jgi:8-oxo-dGTP pyrophosphatase MutT (NUDIX family)
MGKARNPWRVKSSKVVYDNPWIRVKEHKVIHPSGEGGIYGVVHFKNIAIGVLPIDEDENVWMVGQYRFPLGRYSWEIPEGGGNRKKSVLESAKRELKEETGLSAGRWEKLVEMDLSNSATDEVAVVFLARKLVRGNSSPEGSEKLRIKKVPFKKLLKEVLDGKVRDSLTVAAVLAYAVRYVGRED